MQSIGMALGLHHDHGGVKFELAFQNNSQTKHIHKACLHNALCVYRLQASKFGFKNLHLWLPENNSRIENHKPNRLPSNLTVRRARFRCADRKRGAQNSASFGLAIRNFAKAKQCGMSLDSVWSVGERLLEEPNNRPHSAKYNSKACKAQR